MINLLIFAYGETAFQPISTDGGRVPERSRLLRESRRLHRNSLTDIPKGRIALFV
jgi:hypothetical protein